MKQTILKNVAKIVVGVEPKAAFRLTLLRNAETKIHCVNGNIEEELQSEALTLAITLYIEGREGFFYTNVLDDEALGKFLAEAIETTRLLAPDTSRRLPDGKRYYKGGGPDLQNYDSALFLPENYARKLQLCEELYNEVKTEATGALLSADVRYIDRQHEAWYLTSNGLDTEERSSRCTLSCTVSIQGDGDARPMDGWGMTRIFLRDMDAAGIGHIALQRAMQKLSQRPAQPGRYTMVVESPVAYHLMQPLINAMAGQALQQHASFLEGKLGEAVGSPLLDLYDNPHLPGTRGATYFDYDGVATQPRWLFRRGVLQTYFIDTPTSLKLGMTPTTQGVHRIIMSVPETSVSAPSPQKEGCDIARPPHIDPADAVEKNGCYILVTDFNGGNCNPVSGDFSYGIEGLLYRDGKVVQAISGMNITGNMLQLWHNLVDVANDADPWETEVIPSLTFSNVSFV